ncbi:MAG TPA: MFS transporter [Gaiellaceae bacterium]|nr:MFS transporter [Gaiellaceae bacterium]
MDLRPTSDVDRRGRLPRLGILRPLRIRDFALLWAGATVSLAGDGVYVVALAWQVYDLSDSPTALSLVGVAWTLPIGLFVLLGGVVTDRVERRRVMIAADLLRALAAGTIAVLSLTGAVELWHLIALAALFGVGEAFFGPAFTSIVPQIVPRHLLLQANSLDQFVRPLAFMLVGPALGGWMVATVGPGQAFLVDAGTFLVSAAAITLMRPRPLERTADGGASLLRELREGLAFVRARAWLWATLLAAAVFLLAYWGPVEVLVPFRVRHELGGGADDFGLVLACGGVGSILAAVVMGQRRLPRRHITFMYCAWGIGSLALVGLGLATSVWQLMAITLVEGALFTAGMVVWGTLVHTLVPAGLLGRVTSLDWFVSTSLVPVSFALTGPVSSAVGVQTTLVAAGLAASVATLLFLLVPGVRDTERSDALPAALRRPAPEG